MKILVAFIAIAILAGAAPRSSAADTPETAEAAALAWLALLNAGNYPQSWNTAAAYFKNAVPQSQWVSKVAAVRGRWAP